MLFITVNNYTFICIPVYIFILTFKKPIYSLFIALFIYLNNSLQFNLLILFLIIYSLINKTTFNLY